MKNSGFLVFLMAFVTITSAAPAVAIVYQGFQTAGPNGSGTITVQTDGTIGILSASNIVSFAIHSTINGISYNSVSGGPGSDTTIFGSGLSASATSLIFDFTSDGFFGIADFVPGNTGFCVDGAVAPFTCAEDAPSLSFFATISENEFVSVSERRTGIQVIAAAVPEPASWALMIGGFGLIGAAARRHRSALAA